VLFFLGVLCPEGKAQFFYVGLNGGANYSWFKAPKFSNVISSDGYGWNMGFFLRYGKRPYIQAGFDWTRANNDFVFEVKEADFKIEDKVPFHNFDFSIKVGYEIIQTPYFKWSLLGGPFIGRSLLFNSNEFEFSNTDFKNPQYGLIGGTAFQITNFILSLEYSNHLSGLFKPVEVDGYTIDFGSKLQIISLKLGMQF
jgi:hypothetical protein